LNQFRFRVKVRVRVGWKREREGEDDQCKWQMTNYVEQKAFSRRLARDTLDASAQDTAPV
jgi:hypothetical protein